ncbi:MAG TPA: TIGR03435 family protein [Terriglobia bacterium]|jgi:uncharacterized protein (TIGR03435 family)
MKRHLAIWIVCALLPAMGLAFGQTTPALTFEVASVKPAALDMAKLAAQMQATGQVPKIGAHVDKARAEYTFVTLKELIATAYSVKAFQISGPDWLNDLSLRFDIVAKMPDGATVDQAPRMLQALLADRFKLTLHQDTKEHPVMALVVGKGGPKLKESPADPSQDFNENTPLKPGETETSTPQGPVRMTVNPKTGSSVVNMGKRGVWTQQVSPNGTMHLEGNRTTMSAFADMLTQLTQITGGGGAQVVDMTGLKGNYTVALDFSLADLMRIAQAVGINVPPGGEAGRGQPAAASDPGGSSSVADAVQALGLKMESRKAPTEQLVIDHIEKTPTKD